MIGDFKNVSDTEDRSKTVEIPLIGAKVHRARDFQVLHKPYPKPAEFKVFDHVGGVWGRGPDFAVSC